MQNELSLLAPEISGKVVIGASHIPGEYLLPGRLAALYRKYPKIDLKILIGDI